MVLLVVELHDLLGDTGLQRLVYDCKTRVSIRLDFLKSHYSTRLAESQNTHIVCVRERRQSVRYDGHLNSLKSNLLVADWVR